MTDDKIHNDPNQQKYNFLRPGAESHVWQPVDLFMAKFPSMQHTDPVGTVSAKWKKLPLQ